MCLFCEIPQGRVLARNDLAYAIHDGFPVTPLHTLIIPKRHVENYFDLADAEILACNRLLSEFRQQILGSPVFIYSE